ncbi:MAG: S1-like domain-containing RNA-binding protein [Bacteroidales bacterium]|nr:S1-like domain-containing RNA-binding protein [Bacteroidales bacterium]
MDIRLGDTNTLKVVKTVDFGVYLDGGDAGEILLPTRYVPEGCAVGDELEVFLYLDNEERLIATTLHPLVKVGGFACLEVSWVNQYGAFLNWGLMKDLFCPFHEQRRKMCKGERHFVHAYLDESSYRIVASAKIDKFLSRRMPMFADHELVDVIVWQRTPLGWKVVVDGLFAGMIYHNEIFQTLHPGMQLKAYVRTVRPDGKIDLTLQQDGFRKVDSFAEQLLQYIDEHGGQIPFGDKTDADLIYETFEVSKKTFKKAVGDLYRRHLIVIDDNSIAATAAE